MAMSRHTLPMGEHSARLQSSQSITAAADRIVAGSDASDVKVHGTDPVPARGFTALPNAVLLSTILSRDARLLYALLLHHAWQDRCCFPSHATLAAELGAGETMLRLYLRELERAGLISQRRRGQGRSNLYVLHIQGRQGGEKGQSTIQSEDKVELLPERGASCRSPKAEKHAPGTVKTAFLEPHQTAPDKDVSEQHTDIGSSNIRSDTGFDAATTKPSLVCANASAEAGPVVRTEGQGAIPGPARPQLHLDPAYQALAKPVGDLAEELGDGAPICSTLTRAYNLFGRSELTGPEFLARLEEARALTWTHRNRVTRRSMDPSGRPRANLLPYCFAVLERMLAAKVPGGDPPAARSSLRVDEPMPEPNPLWRAVLHELRTMVAPSVLARCRTARVVQQQAHVLQVAAPDCSLCIGSRRACAASWIRR